MVLDTGHGLRLWGGGTQQRSQELPQSLGRRWGPRSAVPCGHCLAQSHRLDMNSDSGDPGGVRLRGWALPPLNFPTPGHAVVAKLGYSWNF